MSSELKEIEMEDIEEAAPDIDSCDAGNSLAVVEHETVDAILNVVGQLTYLAPSVLGAWIDLVVVLLGEHLQNSIHAAQLLLQEADPALDVFDELVLLGEHGGQLADDEAHHARGGSARHHFRHLDSQRLSTRSQ